MSEQLPAGDSLEAAAAALVCVNDGGIRQASPQDIFTAPAQPSDPLGMVRCEVCSSWCQHRKKVFLGIST